MLNGPEDNDVQLILASSRDSQSLERHMFADFYSRYCQRPFEIKTLWERTADFIAFVSQLASDNYRDIDEDLIEAMLTGHQWPRNYREVREFVEEVCSKLPDGCLDLPSLQKTIDALCSPVQVTAQKVLAGGRPRSRNTLLADVGGKGPSTDELLTDPES